MNLRRILFTLVSVSLLTTTGVAVAEIKRTAAGHPDLTGTYDSGTLTPESARAGRWPGAQLGKCT